MKSYELVDGVLTKVPDPTYNDSIADCHESIVEAGYMVEASNCIADDGGAEIRLYQLQSDAAKNGKPRFYIDITGQFTGIASFIAYDFPQLMETLKYIHPLITLFGLDQVSTMHTEEQLRREGKI